MPRNPLKALTVCQPWAWAIAEGHKRVENRTWATRYRGPLAIHAGKSEKWMAHGLDQIEQALGIRPHEETLAFGAVICVVDLVACHTLDYAIRHYPWIKFHPFADGPFCWILQHPKRLLEPLPATGRQGLWNWMAPDEITPQTFGRHDDPIRGQRSLF